MGLTFRNETAVPVSVAIMFLSPDTCSGEGLGWEMQGWWNISSGDSALVYANDLEDLNRYWYFYAQASDGTSWHGDGTWIASVPDTQFDQCYGIGVNPGEELDFVQIDVSDNDDWTQTLIR